MPNPFGEKSEIRFPDYHEPAWLMTAVTGPVRNLEIEAGRLHRAGAGPAVVTGRAFLGPRCPTPAGARRVGHGRAGSLLSWASAMSSTSPVRVALLDPAVGLRNEWYAADPDYADHLAEVVLPALTAGCSPVR